MGTHFAVTLAFAAPGGPEANYVCFVFMDEAAIGFSGRLGRISPWLVGAFCARGAYAKRPAPRLDIMVAFAAG